MKPLNDELLQSWIFRIQQKHGIFRVDNVIGNKGHWLSFPKLPKNFEHLYEPFDERALLSEIAFIGGLINANNMFFSPEYNHIYLKQLIGLSGKASASSPFTQPVRYCRLCIEESITSNGFGYFKKNWYFSNYCGIHESYLYRCSSLKRANTFDALQEILAGIPRSDDECSSDERVSQYSGVQRLVENFIAPCLLDAFAFFLIRNKQSSDDLLRISSIHTQMSKKRNKLVHDVFFEILDKVPDVWQLFLENESDTVDLPSGVIEPSEYLTKTHKLKGRKCNDCDIISCISRSAFEHQFDS